MNAHLPPEALDDWLAAAATELGISGADVPIGRILSVAADVAHGVARPAAPLSTFLLGLAYGLDADAGARGETSAARLDELATKLTELANSWDAGEPQA